MWTRSKRCSPIVQWSSWNRVVYADHFPSSLQITKDLLQKSSLYLFHLPLLTLHEGTPSFGAGFWYGQRKRIDSNAIGNRQWIEPFIGCLARYKLPQQHTIAPHIRWSATERGEVGVYFNSFINTQWSMIDSLGIHATAYDLRWHPGIGASGAHALCIVHFPCQSKVGYL